MKAIDIVAALVATLVAASPSLAETPKPSATQQAVTAKVMELTGRVEHRLIGQDQWQPTKKGDILKQGTEIRTGARGSSVLLKLHTTALVQLRSFTRVAVAELTRMPGRIKTRLNLRRGTIRAGIIEEEKIISDFQIACPTAVLSREGTWGIEMSYDPFRGSIRAKVDTDGLVRVRNTLTGKQMTILPGQYMTQAMQMWTRTAVFDRMVSLTDPFGVTRIEQRNYAENPGGLAASDPTGGGLAKAVTAPPAVVVPAAVTQWASQQAGDARRTVLINLLQQRFRERQTQLYQSGNFGTHIRDQLSQLGAWENVLTNHLSNNNITLNEATRRALQRPLQDILKKYPGLSQKKRP